MKYFIVKTDSDDVTARDVLLGMQTGDFSVGNYSFEEVKKKPKDDERQGALSSEVLTAPQFLMRAVELLGERGQDYDKEQERSGDKIAQAFSAITGIEIGAAEVYLMLQIVKDVRQWTAKGFHRDSAEDSVSYAALKSEALAGEVS